MNDTETAFLSLINEFFLYPSGILFATGEILLSLTSEKHNSIHKNMLMLW